MKVLRGFWIFILFLFIFLVSVTISCGGTVMISGTLMHVSELDSLPFAFLLSIFVIILNFMAMTKYFNKTPNHSYINSYTLLGGLFLLSSIFIFFYTWATYSYNSINWHTGKNIKLAMGITGFIICIILGASLIKSWLKRDNNPLLTENIPKL